MPRPTNTIRHQRVLDFIAKYQPAYHVAPTTLEIAHATNIPIPTVNDYLTALQLAGRLVKHRQGNRLWYEVVDGHK